MRTLEDWLAWQQTLHPSAIDLGLDRVRRVLERLEWRRPSCPIITIGGTNGKGSCAAMTAAILRACGLRVGVFTSPHLVRYQERITIDGREAQESALVHAFERIDAARGPDTLTFFEFNTLAALLLFDEARLDTLVLEVGMGGRLDAVNVVDADVALVTSVALDHCEWLGGDIEAIGREKAGIFRARRPAIFGARDMPESIEQAASDVGAQLLRLGRDFDYSRCGERWSWKGPSRAFDDLPRPPLLGAVQYDNAAAVLCALHCLGAGLPLDRETIERGLANVRLPGRFQTIHAHGVDWILDVAHNPAAALTLAAQLRERSACGSTFAVCGMLADKDVEGAVAPLIGLMDGWIAAGLPGERGVCAQRLAERLRSAGARVDATAVDVRSACETARRLAQPGDRIVVFGSFLTVGAALEALDAA